MIKKTSKKIIENVNEIVCDICKKPVDVGINDNNNCYELLPENEATEFKISITGTKYVAGSAVNHRYHLHKECLYNFWKINKNNNDVKKTNT